MLKKIIIILAILIIVVIAVYFIKHSFVLIPNGEEGSEENYVGWSDYKNEKFGFSLKFPLSWDGYEVSEGDYPTYSYAGFSFSNSHRPFLIFQILQFDKNQWQAVKDVPAFRILDKTEERTLVCDGCCQENQDFSGGGQFDEFQIERCKEGPEIMKTFRAE
ncbi:MAG: hypothetical protein PHZ04_01425 [Patescibacteria group bacterium]|nr:hypothetical protein [Patescibacteria group bacterium]MDD5294898.1 hypothetical protein [Patescibacteria group bacterium]MDD5554361.1 hypothetical protein [Patescibacteria group bacterium]